MAVNKVVINTPEGERTLIDLMGDTVTEETLLKGTTAHNASGEVITGTMVQPIKYIESLDETNLVNFRDLESGQYVIYGYFSPYANSDIAISADNSLISVIWKSAGSHIICLDPLNAKVVFFEILVDDTQEKGFTYTRTIIPMLDVYGLIEKVGTLDELTTEEKSNLVGAINEVLTKIPSRQGATHGVVTSGSGSVYTATVEGIDQLVAGATFIMIPHTTSTVVTPKLNVNGLGEKNIRRRVSNSTVTTVAASSTNWLYANKPIRMMYDGTYWIADLDRPNANDIYGTLPVANGGVPSCSDATEGQFLRVVNNTPTWCTVENAEVVSF